MPAAAQTPTPAPDDLEAAADQAIAACGGDAREAVKALLVTVDFQEAQFEELRSAVSSGYVRRRYDVRRDRRGDASSEG